MGKSYDIPQFGSVPVLDGVPNLEIVVLQWARNHGDCQECGLPAAFYDTPYKDGKQRKLCAVCAANSAVDGETIRRIDPQAA